MTQEKKNDVMHWVQTILLGLISAGIIACIGFLWSINAVLAVNAEKDKEHDNSIEKLNANYKFLDDVQRGDEKQQSALETRVIILEKNQNK